MDRPIQEYVDVLGYSHKGKERTRQQILATIHPDDHALFIGSVDQLTPQNSTSQVSYRRLRPDGSVIWLEKSARGFFDEQGKLLRMIGMVANITERKLAEAAVASVSRRLIEAQEQERSRIARELHDDIGPRLAILAINCFAQTLLCPPNSSELPGRIGELQKQTSEIAADIQSLSHDLHSSRLEFLGIVAAVRGREFGEQHKWRLTAKSTIYQSRCRRTSHFASSEFCKKPCTIQQNTVGYSTSRLNCGERWRMRFIRFAAVTPAGFGTRPRAGEPRAWPDQHAGASETPEWNAFNRIPTPAWYCVHARVPFQFRKGFPPGSRINQPSRLVSAFDKRVMARDLLES